MVGSDGSNSFEPPKPPPASPAPPAFLPPPIFTPLEAPPNATVVPVGAPGKRGKGKVVGSLVAVVALLAAGGFAVTRIASGDEGGAASPEQVGTQLLDSLASEDALGVVDLLLPGEREVFRQPLIDFVDHLKRLQIIDENASLDKIGGLDLAFDGVQVETTSTNVEDISNIHITGTGTASIDGAAVPIGDLLIEEAFGGERPDLGSDSESSDVDLQLTTVKRDGRWYLSAFYSLAETSRPAGTDIPETGIALHGAGSPEGAVQSVFDSVAGLDLEGLIGVLNPNEAEALQRYAPMFIDDAQKALADADPRISFTNLAFSVSGTGDRRSVSVDAFKLNVTTPDGDVTVESKDGCLIVTEPDTTTNTCEVTDSLNSVIGVLGADETGDVKSFFDTVQAAFADMKPTGVTVQQVSGAWYVSPIGTFFDVVLNAMAALDSQELHDIIEGARKLTESMFTGGLFGDGFVGGDSQASDGDVGSVGGFGDTTALDACYEPDDFAAYSACVSAGIADGSIDGTLLVPYYRFAECGVGESYWNGDVYVMSDEDFTAFVTAAAPCFQTHVADGTITESELPFELSHPECLEGRNWYMVTDQDYVDRVFECVG